jgi:hypothetical protein
VEYGDANGITRGADARVVHKVAMPRAGRLATWRVVSGCLLARSECANGDGWLSRVAIPSTYSEAVHFCISDA